MVTRSNGNLLFEGGLAPRGGLNQYFVPGTSPSMRALELSIADIAPTDIPVLLVGESGTGKEVIALEIHRLSERSNGIFVQCGCAGLTAESLIARLNSGERGTGDGETASGSLFLDEVGNLDLASQSRLLDMLADGPGMEAQNHVRMRIISSTTRSLEHEMRSGRFRQELYYRISGVSLHLPPLRERKQDISGLLEFFLKKYASLFGWPEPQLGSATIDLLMRHSWPGNVRELENTMERSVALETGNTISVAVLPEKIKNPGHRERQELAGDGKGMTRIPESGMDLEKYIQELERTYILSALASCNGVGTRAAELLKMSYRSFRHYSKKYNIR